MENFLGNAKFLFNGEAPTGLGELEGFEGPTEVGELKLA